MIHYQLRCTRNHEFDGWFKDSAAFDAQAAGGMLQCPVCGDAQVVRALMSPAVSKGTKERVAAPAVLEAPGRAQVAATVGGPVLPDRVRAMLQRLRAEVEARCDYVGADFADEARRIHNGESERQGIYGEATPEQAEALAEEGISVARIPWLPRADS